MAPRKEKTEKASADQGAAMVLEYLRKQNRPYSATDISTNLHNKVSKTATAKYLKDLHDRKEIEGRAAGKQLVYHSLQDAPTTSTEDLAKMEITMNTLREAIATAKTTEKTLKTELSTLSSVTSAEDLRSTVDALQAQKQRLLDRLTMLKKVEVKPVCAEEKRAVEEKQKMWKKHAGARKRIVKELWLKCLDTMGEEGGTAFELWEQLGCEGEMP